MVETEALASIFRISGLLVITGNLSSRADTGIENIVGRGLAIIRKGRVLLHHGMDMGSPHQTGHPHRNDEVVKRDVEMDSTEAQTIREQRNLTRNRLVQSMQKSTAIDLNRTRHHGNNDSPPATPSRLLLHWTGDLSSLICPCGTLI